MRWNIVFLGFAVCLTTAGVCAAQTAAHGDAPRSTASPTARPAQPNGSDSNGRQWYGEPIIGLDLTAVGLVAIGAATGGGTGATLALVGLGTYAIGGPIVHSRHDNLQAGGSLLLRLGLPVVGAFVGSAIVSDAAKHCDGEMCGLGIALEGIGVGFAVGAVTASVLDISLLAYDRPATTTTASSHIRLVPQFDPKRNMAGMSVQGIW